MTCRAWTLKEFDRTALKELTAAILGKVKPTAKNYKNFNNRIGLPLSMLEAGAEDVIADDEGAIEVLTGPTEFEAVKDALAAAGLTPEVAEVTMRAENTIALAGEDAAKMQKLLDALEDQDDVQNVYHNAELDLE